MVFFFRNNSDDNRSNSSCPNSPQNEFSVISNNSVKPYPSPKLATERATEYNVNLSKPNSITITISNDAENNNYALPEVIEAPPEIETPESKPSNLDMTKTEHDTFFQNNCTIIQIEETPPETKDENYDSNLNISTNSLLYTTESDNASSPIQTSTDHFMSSDIFSNNSDSPKSLIIGNQASPGTKTTAFVVKNFKTELYEPKVYQNNIVEFTEKKGGYLGRILDSPPAITGKHDFGDNESTTSDYVTDTVLGKNL